MTWRVVPRRKEHTGSSSIIYPPDMDMTMIMNMPVDTDHSMSTSMPIPHVKELYHDLDCLQLSHMALDIATSGTSTSTGKYQGEESNQYSVHDIADQAEVSTLHYRTVPKLS